MSTLQIFLWGIVFCSALMSLNWIISVKLNFYSVVDVFWAFGLGLLVVFYAMSSDGVGVKKFLAVCIAILWSLRLGTHLALRLRSHFPKEDSRYAELKEKWTAKNFFFFFQIQALSQCLFSLPFLFIAIDKSAFLSFYSVIGVIVFVIGLVGESIADRQLQNFRKQTENRGQVCSVGLWRYSRHPNYFFEWIVWCGIGLTALDSHLGWIGLISPVLMYITLNYFTGVPTAEAQSLKSKKEVYKSYQATTNRFFPGLPL